MPDEKVCIVKLVDFHDVEHSVRVRASSVYEAALIGLRRLERMGWESNGKQIADLTVEVWETPTIHRVNIERMLQWLKQPGKTPKEMIRKDRLRAIISR